MDLDKRKIVEFEAIDRPPCERPKHLDERPEPFGVGLQQDRVRVPR
jgi:hypothetical protein